MGSEKKKKDKKDKKDKKKKEKKSKKKSKSKSRNREKQRQREVVPKQQPQPQEKAFRFDSPPKDPLQNTPFNQQKLRILNEVPLGDYESILPANPLQNPVASLEALQAMTPLIQMQRLQQLRAQADVKADRKLYVGNLPPNTQPKELQDFLNQALLKMGVSSEHAGSICNCWIDTNGHFGFIEFRSPEEATQGFILKEVIFRGHALKIGRPKSFLTQLAAANAQMMNEQPLNPLSSIKSSDKDSLIFRPLRLTNRYVQIPTNILVIKNVLTLEDVTIDEEYFDILEDVYDEAQKFGTVRNVLIPRPDNGQVYPGVGKIYIEYEKIQEARTARRYINGRMYGEKSVECCYISKDKWENKRFTELNEDILKEKEEQQKLELQEQERLRKQMQEEYVK